MTTVAPRRALSSALRSWTDPVTRREVTQLTSAPDISSVGYFRTTKHLPDGRVLARRHGPGDRSSHLIAIDAATGDIEQLKQPIHGYIRSRPEDGRTWFQGADPREVWQVDLPYGSPQRVARIPDHVPGSIAAITCDGRTLILEEYRNKSGPFPIPTGHDSAELWRYINRRRSGAIYAYDLHSGRAGRLVEMDHVSPAHSDPSPADPTLLRFTEDVLEFVGQRMFSIRTDGADPRPLRPQEYGEMITHEFWWADPNFIGYTYIDRRDDDTALALPWCEYAERPTHLGICDLHGREVYLSDPLNSYHAHLYMSPDGRIVSGEGTAHNSFVSAGLFDFKNPRLQMHNLAAVHTHWIPTRGQATNCAFSADGQWLLFNDTIDGKLQICRVKADL